MATLQSVITRVKSLTIKDNTSYILSNTECISLANEVLEDINGMPLAFNKIQIPLSPRVTLSGTLSAATVSTLTASGFTDNLAGEYIEILTGAVAGAKAQISGNTASVIHLLTNLSVAPAAGDTYQIVFKRSFELPVDGTFQQNNMMVFKGNTGGVSRPIYSNGLLTNGAYANDSVLQEKGANYFSNADYYINGAYITFSSDVVTSISLIYYKLFTEFTNVTNQLPHDDIRMMLVNYLLSAYWEIKGDIGSSSGYRQEYEAEKHRLLEYFDKPTVGNHPRDKYRMR